VHPRQIGQLGGRNERDRKDTTFHGD
jgi:hypothetical protein